MHRPEDTLLESVAKEATDSILANYSGIAPFDIPALIIRPGFENNPFADEPLQIIWSAVRLAIATVIQDVTMIPDSLDNFFSCVCRAVFDRLKMAPVLNHTSDIPNASGTEWYFIKEWFMSLHDLWINTEIGVPINRLIPFIPENENEKILVYPKMLWMRQLRELQESMPQHRESFALQTLLKNIMNDFIDFTQEVLKLTSRDNLDNYEYRAAMLTLRLEFLTKIWKYHSDISYGEFFDPDNEEAVLLEYIQKRLKEILAETKQYLISQE